MFDCVCLHAFVSARMSSSRISTVCVTPVIETAINRT